MKVIIWHHTFRSNAMPGVGLLNSGYNVFVGTHYPESAYKVREDETLPSIPTPILGDATYFAGEGKKKRKVSAAGNSVEKRARESAPMNQDRFR